MKTKKTVNAEADLQNGVRSALGRLAVGDGSVGG
jgi:hypothetical protein